MSSVVIDSKDDLIKFLQILAEESVGSARDMIEKDSQQDSIISKMKMDSEIYDLSEQEDEEEVIEDEEEFAEEEVEVEDEPAPMTQDVSSEESLEVSLDSITDAVNQLRGGRSTADGEIKTQLRTYFDRLDETERQALLTFLKAFSGILTGGMGGSDAPDPSEPPTGITMSAGSEESSQEEEDVESEEEDLADDEFEFEDEEEDAEEGEDTTPPIQAGKSQELAEIRKRVRKLMSKR